MQQLGWANGWNETPAIVKKCRELQHWKTPDFHEIHDSPRGDKNIVRCDVCNYIYYYDSTD